MGGFDRARANEVLALPPDHRLEVFVLGVHWEKGFFSQNGGFELPLLIAAATAGLAFTGAGEASVDAALGLPLSGARWGILALVLGLLGAVPPLLARSVGSRRRAAAR
jgi:putative oxidoreductase